jgi:hypothetical protein
LPEKEIGKKEAGRNYPIIRDINTKSYNTLARDASLYLPHRSPK